jgi:hypothetical protein
MYTDTKNNHQGGSHELCQKLMNHYLSPPVALLRLFILK